MRWYINIISVLILIFLVFSYCCERKPKEIKIGALLPLTGSAAKYGENAKRGIDLAVDEINSEGGIKGRKIQIVYEDTQALPQQGVAAIRKLIIIEKVPVVIGAMASSVTLAIAPVAEENRVVLLSPASSNTKITTAGDYIFRNCISDVFEGAQMAEVAYNIINLRKIAILYINNDYGVGLENVFKTKFKDNGGDIVISEPFEQDATDFRTQLTKIKRTNPEAVYLVGYKEMILILKQANELNLKVQMLSTIMFDDPEILEKAGNAAEGVIFTTWVYDPKSEKEEVRNFTQEFKKRYNTEPGIFVPEAYDALKIIALVIKKGGYNALAIKKALFEIHEYPGVSGVTSFDSNGDVIKPLRLKTVKNGQFVEY